ncbi:FxDxF family PEP-CTERM protein [Janthinobacterium agaricidamnosum]|uniref:PEP-CTERM putative exosortase interaction domain protein n=1 Tax=Janthinobacterium agaricidamnosum NBRC 102515 = DSM 9628 TaxID=1349767 RepID=W0V2Q4_9BURK|nr:FxDxF family PEP-CTERM protein [Janthinobacterium agaricidamnosum]CDG81542.1 PEP-CTERM putative exosortase interaction domain protein [Janthinobacterium agaricidamnosum NBRC 102515 = DSM 9628]
MKRLLIAAATVALFSVNAHGAVPVLKNASFEINLVGNDYGYGQVAPDWVFTGKSGVSASGTAWGGAASDGRYFAFLQTASSISQTFATDEAGDYTFTFDLALRPVLQAGQVVGVSLDGQQLGRYTFDGPGWSNRSATALNVGAGKHTLTFTGLTNAGDTSAFVDNVKVLSAVPEPETYAMMLAGFGLLGFVVRRRKTAA